MDRKEGTTQDIRSYVRERYGQIAQQFLSEKGASCCGPAASCCSGVQEDVPERITVDKDGELPVNATRLYPVQDIAHLPSDVTALSLGCGDPVTLAALEPGQTVLDLGSGGGIDCFLAAKRVGATGRVIGVDMTPMMLERARANKAQLGADNVEFRLGEIEHLPVADGTVDLVISNCVINLSPDKPQVFREAFRVLRPGGRLAVSDVVTQGELPPAVRSNLSAWADCVAGALDVREYIAAVEAAGFTDVTLTPVYRDKKLVEGALEQLDQEIDWSGAPEKALQRAVFSARVEAFKPDS